MNFEEHLAADLVMINLGTDGAHYVKGKEYIAACKKLIEGFYGKMPDAQVIIVEMWIDFYQSGSSYGSWYS